MIRTGTLQAPPPDPPPDPRVLPEPHNPPASPISTNKIGVPTPGARRPGQRTTGSASRHHRRRHRPPRMSRRPRWPVRRRKMNHDDDSQRPGPRSDRHRRPDQHRLRAQRGRLRQAYADGRQLVLVTLDRPWQELELRGPVYRATAYRRRGLLRPTGALFTPLPAVDLAAAIPQVT